MNILPTTSYRKSAQRHSWHDVSKALTVEQLYDQNQRFSGTSGVSQENRGLGFLPAFSDACTGKIYMSRFADGRLAPMHLLEGLPETVVEQRDKSGHITQVAESVIAGFVRDGHFYTREQAANFAADH